MSTATIHRQRLASGMSSRAQRASAVLVCLMMVCVSAGCASPEDSAPAATTSPSDALSEAVQTGSLLSGRLFFTRGTAGAGDVQAVYLMTGTEEHALTDLGEVCCILRASPTDESLLVMPGEIAPPITGATLDTRGHDLVPLPTTDPTLNLVPQAWSPDGSRIAFEGWDDSDPSRTGIYIARASDGGELDRVTNRPGRFDDVPMDFSPDGTQLVFYMSMHPDPDPHTDGSLWVVGIDGSDPHPITSEESPPADWARWSPDGTRILFASERLSETGRIWTVSPDGSGLTTLFEGSNGEFAIAPDWSPDGTEIVFALDRSNDQWAHQPNSIYVMTAAGTGLRLVSDTPDFKSQLEWVE